MISRSLVFILLVLSLFASFSYAQEKSEPLVVLRAARLWDGRAAGTGTGMALL